MGVNQYLYNKRNNYSDAFDHTSSGLIKMFNDSTERLIMTKIWKRYSLSIISCLEEIASYR